MRYCMAFVLAMMTLPCWGAPNPDLENLGTFGDWTAYVYNGEGGKICYMATEPTKSSGKYAKRDDVFLMITHRPSEKAFNVVSIMAGYTYKKASKPSLTIDNKKAVSLVVNENTAWAKDAKTDVQLVEQMKAGSLGVLKGTSKRGTNTTDTFSFKGFSKAYDKISEACGHK